MASEHNRIAKLYTRVIRLAPFIFPVFMSIITVIFSWRESAQVLTSVKLTEIQSNVRIASESLSKLEQIGQPQQQKIVEDNVHEAELQLKNVISRVSTLEANQKGIRSEAEFGARLFVTAIVLIFCFILLISDKSDTSTKKWATGTIGVVVGYWLGIKLP